MRILYTSRELFGYRSIAVRENDGAERVSATLRAVYSGRVRTGAHTPHHFWQRGVMLSVAHIFGGDSNRPARHPEAQCLT